MLATLRQTAELVELFRQKGTLQTYKKGEYIIRPGAPKPGIFYIYKGIVKTYDITRYKEENLLVIKKEGEIFPLIWALTGRERQVIYQALVDTTVWRIDRGNFTNFLHGHTDALAPLLDISIEMYRLHSERILNLQYRSVRERLISFLLTMSQRFYKQTDQGLLIDVPLKQQDIASSINATRETTSRELAALERKNLLENQRSFILLKDIPALRRLLSPTP